MDGLFEPISSPCFLLSAFLLSITTPSLSPTSTSSFFVSYSCSSEMISLKKQSPHLCLSFPLPPCCRPLAEGQNNGGSTLPTSIVVSLPTAPPPAALPSAMARPNNSLSNRKPGVLPANLEEMKVFVQNHIPRHFGNFCLTDSEKNNIDKSTG